MIDNRNLLAATRVVNVIDNTGIPLAWVNNGITVGAKAFNTVWDANSTTGFLLNPNLNNQGQSIQFLGGVLTFTGTVSSISNPTALVYAFTIALSDDGSTVATNSQTITGTATIPLVGTAPALGNVNFYLSLPRIYNHKYLRVSWTRTFTGGTAPTLNNVGTNLSLALELFPDSRAATDMA